MLGLTGVHMPALKGPRAAGHNADDIAETVLLNILRGDVPRLGRCANIITGTKTTLTLLANMVMLAFKELYVQQNVRCNLSGP